jgi:hypothetical protein
MKNCLIMGFGRSGTSLMGGILHSTGYYMGENLYPPRHSNPMGFFENDFINGINERILEKYDFSLLTADYPKFEKPFSPYKPYYGHRWLTYISPEMTINQDDPILGFKIREAVARPSFAYKDPRFNYTLPVWEKYLDEEVILICMFRQPDITVESVIKECATADYLSQFYIDRELAYKLWYNSYTRLIRNLETVNQKRIIFIHYQQLLNRQALSGLSEILQAPLDYSFVSDELNRTQSAGKVPEEVMKVYLTLCDLAAYREI